MTKNLAKKVILLEERGATSVGPPMDRKKVRNFTLLQALPRTSTVFFNSNPSRPTTSVFFFPRETFTTRDQFAKKHP